MALPRRSASVPFPVASGGFQLSVPLPPLATGRPVMKAGQLELSPFPATASDAGRGTGPNGTLGSLYLRRAKVGLFLPDQRVMSVFCKDPAVHLTVSPLTVIPSFFICLSHFSLCHRVPLPSSLCLNGTC